MTEQNVTEIPLGGTIDVEEDFGEPVNAMGLTAAEFEALDDQGKEDAFVKAAVAAGTELEDAKKVYQIITKIAPVINVENIEALGLPLGPGTVRVGREYDTSLDALGLDGYTDIILMSGLGPIRFSVSKAALLTALTVEVPHVSPQKAPQES